MSTQDSRWSAETERLVAAALTQHEDRIERDGDEASLSCSGCPNFGETIPVDSDWRHFIDAFRVHRAQSILTALADVGLLVPADGETRQEWVAESTQPSGAISRRLTTGVENLAEFIAWMRATDPYATGHRVVSRTVHTGPWVEVTEADGSQT